MNYISCIVQILEIPTTIEVYDYTIEKIKFKVQLPYSRNKLQLEENSSIIVYSVIWGNLVYDLLNYYNVNDYVLIEAYISTSLTIPKNKRLISLNIIKMFPLLF